MNEDLNATKEVTAITPDLNATQELPTLSPTMTITYHQKTYVVTRREGDHPKAPFSFIDGNGQERLLFQAAKPFISHIRGRAPQPLYMIFTPGGNISAAFIQSQDGTRFIEVR